MVTISEPLQLVLYSTSACHLCEQALALLQPHLGECLSVQEQDISGSDELFERYGVLIPVLRRTDSDAELHWPFDEAALLEFLAKGA
ncbi:MAG: glutaredoxin family protein [Halieaceae bacterium]